MIPVASRDVRRVLSAEDAFDAQLPWPRMEGSPSRALLSAARRWSERVWESALEADPIRLDARDIERGLRMIEAPIFICGAHRSGTTLLRNLLDSHPAISMLPSEGTFFTNLEPFLRRQSIESWLHWMGREWLRRLANPINQAPYWLLGRTSEECSPYIGFARSLMAWWPLTSVRLCALSSWPITAVALAYAQCTRALAKTSSVARWGEKTPLNERFLPRLLTEFPLGQIIQLVRHPVDVYASRARLDPSLRKSKKNAKRVLEELAMSYRIGATPRSDRFRVIRYEDLVADTQGTMKDLAGFLGIEYDEGLLKPTVAGHLAQRNSSFALDPAPGDVLSGRVTVRDKILSDEDYALIASVTREAAAAFGYDV